MFIHRPWMRIVLILFMQFWCPLFSESFSETRPLASCKRGRCDPPIPTFPIAYGEIYTTGTVTQDGITTPTQLTTFNMNGISSNTIPNFALNRITILNSGYYIVSFIVSVEASVRNWRFQVAVNGVAQPNLDLQTATNGTSNDTLAGATSGLLILTAGDVITILVSQSDGATTLEVESANLTVTRFQ